MTGVQTCALPIFVIDGVGTQDEVFSEIRGVLEECFADRTPNAAQGAESSNDNAEVEAVVNDTPTAPRVRSGRKKPMLHALAEGQATLWAIDEQGALL